MPQNTLFSRRPSLFAANPVGILRPSRLVRSAAVVMISLRLFTAALTAESAGSTSAERPFLSPIFGDHMILQRGKPNTFWGWTTPGEKVRVQINARAGSAVADADGRWQTQVEPPALGEKCRVTIDGARHVELQDVIVGDVWLCGGQSNMEFGLPGAKEGAAEVASANHPEIRLFTVAHRSAYSPVDVARGLWKVCSPQTVAADGGFSAVAYFFALRVQRETGVPIGLIQDCLGGTPVETWMSPATLRRRTDFQEPMNELERLRKKSGPEYGNYLMHWFDEYDLGLRGKIWADPDFDDRGWKTLRLEQAFGALGLGAVPAVVWFRRELILPDPIPTGAATLHLGVIEKMDTAYLNGRWVGASSWVENPRVYRIPDGLLKPGKNFLAVRVLKIKSPTGFLSDSSALKLVFPDGREIPLGGEWKAAVSVDARPPHPLPLGYENYPIMPSVLYQGMIQPLAPLALAGAIWYQGEANANRAFQYRSLLPAMIHDWRSLFGQGDFPFYIVSLPAFQAHRDQPGTDDWAELREAQSIVSRSIAESGLAVAIDTGEADNIHPKDKKPVGERLALVALAKYYHKDAEYSGPIYRSMQRVGTEMRIRFEHATGGLTVHGVRLAEFSIAGHDRKWHWAEARIDGDDVRVGSSEVPEPEAVRYAWQANPEATLFNGAGLPAAPFRTDNWPGETENRPPW